MLFLIIIIILIAIMFAPAIPHLFLGGDDSDFIDHDYDILVDEQLSNVVDDSKQEYLNRDYRKQLMYRFPQFDDDSDIPKKFAHKKPNAIYAEFRDILPRLENKNWTNQTLSYARNTAIGKHIIVCIVQPLYNRGLFSKSQPIKIIDATGNIGGDSIGFAMEKFVKTVDVFEIIPAVYDMLCANIALYGLENKITPHNERFDYKVSKHALVIVDPPYEIGNNSTNFNLSIDFAPIYEVAERILAADAYAVMLTMPRTYLYNSKFAREHNQWVASFRMGDRNNKIFIVTRKERANRCGLGESFQSHNIELNFALRGARPQCVDYWG